MVLAAKAQIADPRTLVSIECPKEGIEPGSTVTLTATIKGSAGNSATYNWTVSNGMITSGQGTSAITMQTGDFSGFITATVEVGGIYFETVRADCSFEVFNKPVPRLVNELTFGAQGELKAIMDGYMTELNNEPTAQGYIVIYPPSRQAQDRVARFIRKFINDRGFDSPRIRIVVGEKRGDRPVLHFWIVPPGAEFKPD